METSPAGTLANLNEDGKPPKSRLATAAAARSQLSQLIEADIPASVDRTRIQKNIDGFPPFTTAELQAAGQGWRANVNWGGARARIRDYLIAFHDIITSTNCLPTVKVTMGDLRQRTTWGQKIAKRFHDLLFQSYKDWGFIHNMQLHHKQLAIHGIGPCFRRTRRDWRFHALKRRNILVPRDSPADLSRIPVLYVRDTMYVTELYPYIRGEKQDSRWNKKATLEAIRGAQIAVPDKFSMEDAEAMWQNNCYDWGLNKSHVVKVAHVFVREFDKVSHHILTEQAITGYQPENEDSGYLYSDVNGLDSISDMVWVCFQEVGNGDFESVRGLGLEAHQFGEMQNRLNNGLADNGLAAGTIVWQADSPEGAEKMTRVEIGPHRIIPSGFTLQQLNTGAGVQAQLAVSNKFSEMESANTGAYRTRATTPSNQSRTATEVEAEIGETSKMSNASVAHYCIQADQLIEGTFRVATMQTIQPEDPGGAAALEFQRKCIEEDGVPEEAFHEICRTAIVGITRPIGNGSYADRVSRLSRIGQFMGEMPERKRRVFVRDNIAYIGGDRELAEMYGPDLEEEFPGIEQSLAILENNGFMVGGSQDPFSPDNAHTVHFPIHYAYALEVIKDPQQSTELLGVPWQPGPLYFHMKEHVNALEGDPTRIREFKQFGHELGALENDMKEMAKIAEMDQLNAPAEGPTPEEQKIQGELTIKAQEASTKVEIERAVAAQEAALRDAEQAQKLRHKEEDQRQKIAEHQQTMALARKQAEKSKSDE